VVSGGGMHHNADQHQSSQQTHTVIARSSNKKPGYVTTTASAQQRHDVTRRQRRQRQADEVAEKNADLRSADPLRSNSVEHQQRRHIERMQYVGRPRQSATRRGRSVSPVVRAAAAAAGAYRSNSASRAAGGLNNSWIASSNSAQGTPKRQLLHQQQRGRVGTLKPRTLRQPMTDGLVDQIATAERLISKMQRVSHPSSSFYCAFPIREYSPSYLLSPFLS
jgi:hypothetical protein